MGLLLNAKMAQAAVMSAILDYTAALDRVLLIVLLGFAAWRDILTRTIPDTVSIALVIVGCLARLVYGWEALALSLLVGVVVFVILLPFCSRGLIGGADLKLLASLAVGLPPPTSLQLITAVTMAGGGLAAIYIVLNKVVVARTSVISPAGRVNSVFRRIASVECWRIRRSAPLPYGIAIAIGAAIVVLNRQGV